MKRLFTGAVLLGAIAAFAAPAGPRAAARPRWTRSSPRPAGLRRVDRRRRLLAAGQQGRDAGIDADGCRAVAAAMLGDATKVRSSRPPRPTASPRCSPARVDVLIRETTWTLGREANLGLEFAGVNYYDGTGFLVKKAPA